jgi:hypothetical protein
MFIMLCPRFLYGIVHWPAFCLLFVIPITSSALQLPPVVSLQGSRSVASPNAHITEAPAQDLVEKNLAKRAFNPCTQWSIVGGMTDLIYDPKKQDANRLQVVK